MSLGSTTDYPLTVETVETTTTVGELFAEFIAAPASSMSPAAIAEHMQQNQITFEIPTAHDLRHIDALHSFNALLQRIGNSAAASASASASISTEQLSNSVVLDLADLRESNNADADNNSTWEQIFGDADMHAIVNYLWIGVVTSLVVLSLVFILFSCYFYRKFRTWKKCNKDIRAQIHAASDSYSSHGASHHLISCDARRLLQQLPAANGAATGSQLVSPIAGTATGGGVGVGGGNEAAFYQIDSPPCYTIATGLPSYDEALHHQPRHFAYGMKFVYPSLAAVHHHHHHHHNQLLQQRACIANWEKDAVQRCSSNKLQKCKLSAAAATAADDSSRQTQIQMQTESERLRQAETEDKSSPAICINMPDEMEEEHHQHQHRNVVANAASTDAAQTLLPAAAADDDCASLVVVVAA
ncbi:hypothetical protein KR215_005878 [Drosophila sulfurigaster]|nr:hypothetical protein KR215_005878 [Drosophila sulfurigaster]